MDKGSSKMITYYLLIILHCAYQCSAQPSELCEKYCSSSEGCREYFGDQYNECVNAQTTICKCRFGTTSKPKEDKYGKDIDEFKNTINNVAWAVVAIWVGAILCCCCVIAGGVVIAIKMLSKPRVVAPAGTAPGVIRPGVNGPAPYGSTTASSVLTANPSVSLQDGHPMNV